MYVDAWQECGDLILDGDGRVFRRVDRGDAPARYERLGGIADLDADDVSPGERPDLMYLRDAWRGAGSDERGERLYDWQLAKGMP